MVTCPGSDAPRAPQVSQPESFSRFDVHFILHDWEPPFSAFSSGPGAGPPGPADSQPASRRSIGKRFPQQTSSCRRNARANVRPRSSQPRPRDLRRRSCSRAGSVLSCFRTMFGDPLLPAPSRYDRPEIGRTGRRATVPPVGPGKQRRSLPSSDLHATLLDEQRPRTSPRTAFAESRPAIVPSARFAIREGFGGIATGDNQGPSMVSAFVNPFGGR